MGKLKYIINKNSIVTTVKLYSIEYEKSRLFSYEIRYLN